MPTVTIPDVELVATGEWNASTGKTGVQLADLEAMLAADADGLVDHAPVKLGHVSKLNDGLGDGAPAYGWVKPTSIVQRGGRHVLLGKLMGVPAALADVMPTAYRRRSVEIAWGARAAGAAGAATGKTYRAALTGLALLGAQAPAVKGLADVVALYADAGTTVESTSTVDVVDGLEDAPHAVAMLSAAREAGASLEVLDALATAAGARDTAEVPAPIAEAPESAPVTEPGAPGATRTGGTTMTKLTDAELRARIGAAEDADLKAAVAELLAGREEEFGLTAPAAEQPAEQTAEQTAQTATAPAAAELVGAGVATLSEGVLAELQRDAAELRANRRAGKVAKAVREGKVLPADEAHFAALMDANEDATTVLLEGLSARFPTSALGAAGAGEVAVGAEQLDAATTAALDAWESGSL